MRETIEKVLRWVSLIFGLVVIGSCTVAGGTEGALGAVAGFFGGAILVGFLLGWIYVYLILSRDLKSIREEIVKLRSGEREGP